MSFSFCVKAKSTGEALTLAKVELDKVLEQQPVHSYDLPSVGETVERYLLLASEPVEGSVLVLNVSGSIWFGHEGLLGGVSVTVSISYNIAPAG